MIQVNNNNHIIFLKDIEDKMDINYLLIIIVKNIIYMKIVNDLNKVKV